VSNPPFFEQALKNPNTGKAMARHTESLSPGELSMALRWLNPNGLFAVIYPPNTFENFRKAMEIHGWFPQRLRKVQPAPGKNAHRILATFAAKPPESIIEKNLIIEENGRHAYSEDYRQLTSDFYLNF
jgi:tRNA1Val (adenine37-N6)-methyltransferase